MTKFDIEETRKFAFESAKEIKHEANEDALRHLLSSRLPLMFPDRPWWVQAHSKGAETNVHFVDPSGARRSGFIDSLVGKTAIEYEKNITKSHGYQAGRSQLKDYCAALLHKGAIPDEVIGVVSATLHWRAFKVHLALEPDPGADYGPNNINLEEIDSVDLDGHNDASLSRFGLFIIKHLGRQGSRFLDAHALAKDLGFDSEFYTNHITKS